MIEAIYYGKFFIGFPTTEDQPGMAYRVEQMKAGISMQDTPNHKDLIRIFSQIQEGITKQNPMSEYLTNV